jgi:hypothetical protein
LATGCGLAPLLVAGAPPLKVAGGAPHRCGLPSRQGLALQPRCFHETLLRQFADRKAIVAWLHDAHYGRRSYSAEMKSCVRGKHYLARKQQHGGARKKASSKVGHLKTADVPAAEYGVASKTVRQDAAFAEALNKLAGHCGEEVRQQVQARVARWTRRDIERLAKLDKATVQEVVRVALVSSKRPKLPSAAEGGRPGPLPAQHAKAAPPVRSCPAALIILLRRLPLAIARSRLLALRLLLRTLERLRRQA